MERKVEVFNANLHEELFDAHRFYDLGEMRRRLATHLHWCNHARTHHALGGLLVPADRHDGRVDEVRARIEAGAGRDVNDHPRVPIARYPLDVLVEGIAIFRAKRRVGALPPAVDARYLLGLVQNIGNEREGIAIADELLRARLDARDRLLAPLVDARDSARGQIPDLRERVLRFVDLALAAERRREEGLEVIAHDEVEGARLGRS